MDFTPITQADIHAALNVDSIDLPDPSKFPLTSYLMSMAIQNRLTEALGEERVRNATLLAGNFGGVHYEDWASEAHKGYAAWVHAGNKPGELKAAARAEHA